MTKMAAMHIYRKNPSKTFFAETAEPIAIKLDMQQVKLEYYNVCIKYGPVIYLTNFTARST